MSCRLRQTVPALLVIGASALIPRASAADEPICDWLDGLGRSAQTRADGIGEPTPFARAALAARPSGAAAARGRLELALALALDGDPRERVESLRLALEGSTPTTRSPVLARLGDALLEAGDPEGGVRAFRTAAAEGVGPLAARVRLRIAAALHAAGAAAEAVGVWKQQVVGDRLAASLTPVDRLAFAADLHATGDAGRAAEILRSLWLESPDRPEADQAERTLAAWRAAGQPVQPFSGEERIARAFRLIAIGRTRDGSAELARQGEGGLPASPEAVLMAEAVGLLAAGDPAGAARKVEPLASSGSPGARRGAALIAARAAARERRFQDAIAAWRTVAATRDRIPGLPSAAQTALGDDAPYFAAWLHFDLGDVARAALELERYARERPRSRRAEDARWFAAWALIRSGDVPAARRALERAEDVPRVRYWRARIATDPDVARELLQSVVTAEPFGYYGLIACARLRSSGTACAEPNLPPGLPPPDPALGADAALLTRAAALAASGLRDEAIELLSSLPFTQGSRAAAPQAAQLAHYLGDPVLPFRLARDRIGLSRATLAWSFPDPWPRLVAASASAAGVDPSLLRAVMRRESGFRTGVVSSAGAVGLLQLLPSTAARLSSLLGQPPPSPSRLELPAVNIPLGAGYFGLLLERFGDPALAIAAYNAGPRAVSRWRQEGPPMALDAWVESIPYRETRQYVRAVLENWAGARAAVGAPPPAIDPDRIIAEPGAGIAF